MHLRKILNLFVVNCVEFVWNCVEFFENCVEFFILRVEFFKKMWNSCGMYKILMKLNIDY